VFLHSVKMSTPFRMKMHILVSIDFHVRNRRKWAEFCKKRTGHTKECDEEDESQEELKKIHQVQYMSVSVSAFASYTHV
jgi:hypothetical protein